jgi:hypothetical protein
MGTRSLMLVEDKGKSRSPSGMTSKKGNGKNNGNSKNNDKGNSKYRDSFPFDCAQGQNDDRGERKINPG